MRFLAPIYALFLSPAFAAEHWAFVPPEKPSLTTIDAFFPDADAEEPAPHILLRRVTYGLTGLPPTPGEQLTFVVMAETLGLKTALAQTVDSLLARSSYGEKWGQHWLDLVRYADTTGCSSDYPVPEAARYRDYVIDAFNRDLPYDEFVRQQLAGDLLPAADTFTNLVATGYLAIARRYGTSGASSYLTVEDQIDNFGTAFLGLTISCARCHDHTHDPISQKDYYALYGIFESTGLPFPGSQISEERFDFSRLGSSDEAPLAYAAFEWETPADAKFQPNGQNWSDGTIVPRGFPEILGGQKLPKNYAGSGREFLAEWLLASENPLTARVIVNRVWGWHFGEPIVPTPNDFGSHGTPPTNPALLDYLATTFVTEDKWSIKSLTRRILASAAYRKSSFRRRLTAEEIVDSIKNITGTLKPGSNGFHPFPEEHARYTQHNPFRATYRSDHRAVYWMRGRLRGHPFLSLFDAPVPMTGSGLRPESETPEQALFFENSAFMERKSRELTAKLDGDTPTRITQAHRLLFSRPPRPEESARGAAFIALALGDGFAEEDIWIAYIQTLFASNAFLYLD